MSEEEQRIWDKNIAPFNKKTWYQKLLRIDNKPKTKKLKTIKDFSSNTISGINIKLLYKIAWFMVGLICLEMILGIVKESVYLVYPNYGNNTQIIRDFLTDLGAN